MRLKRKNPFKTVVVGRSSLTVLLYTLASFCIIVLSLYTFTLCPQEKAISMILNNFFGKNVAYSEIFTDERGRINAIMEGYTMVIGKNREEAAPQVPSPSPEQAPAPKITYSTSTSLAELKNQSGKEVDIEELSKGQLLFLQKGEKPKVLIVHTHTTESYYEQDRSLDENYNMLAIGTVIKDKLEKAGIEVIHDTTVHDYPTYNASYTRSAASTTSNLDNHKGINVVLDVHRDAVATDDGSKLSLSCDINGVKTAQLMFVVGTDAQLTHPKWHENLKLALKLQAKANEMYKGLMRPINLRAQRFNQQLSTGSIIVEVGTNGNTLEEAKQGAMLFSDVLINVLRNNN